MLVFETWSYLKSSFLLPLNLSSESIDRIEDDRRNRMAKKKRGNHIRHFQPSAISSTHHLSLLGFLKIGNSKINHELHCRMARSSFVNLVLAALLVAGPAALTTAYVVPPSASRIGSLAGGSSFSASVAPRVGDFRHASSSSSADMTMRLSVPSALRSFNKKFRGASAAGPSSTSRIGMSDAAAAAEPEDEKKSILQKVSFVNVASYHQTIKLSHLHNTRISCIR